MNWLTVLWSMASAVCFTLAFTQLLVWTKQRGSWAYLFFATMALGASANALLELKLMHTTTIAEYAFWMRGENLALFVILVSMVWSVRHFFGSGRTWLAVTITAIWSAGMIVNFTSEFSLAFSEIHQLLTYQTLGGVHYTIADASPNPWTLLTELSLILILIFILDASVTQWRQGNRRRAITVGGSIVVFLIAAGIHTPLVDRGVIHTPYMVSFAFMAIAAAMGSELAHDAVRVAQLSREVAHNEKRWRSLLEQVELAVIGYDANWRLNYSNPYFLRVTGYTHAQLIGQPTSFLLAPTEQSQMEDRKPQIETHGPRPVSDWKITCADGSQRMFTWSNVALKSPTQDFMGTLSIGQDITDRLTAERHNRDLRGRLIHSAEEERTRIARELHDDITQRLARLAIDTGRAGDPQLATAARGELLNHCREALAELSEDVHNLAYRLHPAALEELGLVDALQTECERFKRAHQISIDLSLKPIADPIPDPVALGLFRVAQESLRNIARHAAANQVTLSLAPIDDGLRLVISDDGCGFDPNESSRAFRLGHASMRERVQLLDGELDIDSRPGHGVTLMAWVPLTSTS